MAEESACHCGRLVHVYDEPGMEGFSRGLCLECSTVRCDVVGDMVCGVRPSATDPCCWRCVPNYQFMLVCPTCGNKRCPRANNHDNACTRSNEPGQPGSAYPTVFSSHTVATPTTSQEQAAPELGVGDTGVLVTEASVLCAREFIHRAIEKIRLGEPEHAAAYLHFALPYLPVAD